MKLKRREKWFKYCIFLVKNSHLPHFDFFQKIDFFSYDRLPFCFAHVTIQTFYTHFRKRNQPASWQLYKWNWTDSSEFDKIISSVSIRYCCVSVKGTNAKIECSSLFNNGFDSSQLRLWLATCDCDSYLL